VGRLAVPASGRVYVDTQVVIYTVEKHPVHERRLRPLWQAVQAGSIEVVTSELTLLEVLVAPLRRGDRSG
jgi:predicted nucleic acid-binding protein